MDDPKKFVFPALVSIFEKRFPLTFVVRLWRIRVGKDPALCGLLNEEYDTFVVVAEPRVILRVLVCSCVFLLSALNSLVGSYYLFE